MSRLWALLVALCAAGSVLSAPFLLALLRAAHPPMSPLALLVLHGAQTLVLCAIAAYAGVRFAPRAGLDAPWLRAIAERRDRPPAFGSMAIESAAVGSITAIEETLVRWGLMTALIGLGRRAGMREAFWPANALAALVFGALHLPAVALLRIPLTGGVLAYVLLGNALAGVVFGWMFRRRGLEGAMVAHGAADVWLQAALPALLA